jgi:hypothetical protein
MAKGGKKDSADIARYAVNKEDSGTTGVTAAKFFLDTRLLRETSILSESSTDE